MRERSTRRTMLLSAGAAIAAGVVGAPAAHAATGSTPIKVVSFPGFTNLPIFAASRIGSFGKYDLDVDLSFTPNSQSQRDGLANGEFQIIHTAADNAVAMV